MLAFTGLKVSAVLALLWVAMPAEASVVLESTPVVVHDSQPNSPFSNLLLYVGAPMYTAHTKLANSTKLFVLGHFTTYDDNAINYIITLDLVDGSIVEGQWAGDDVSLGCNGGFDASIHSTSFMDERPTITTAEEMGAMLLYGRCKVGHQERRLSLVKITCDEDLFCSAKNIVVFPVALDISVTLSRIVYHHHLQEIIIFAGGYTVFVGAHQPNAHIFDHRIVRYSIANDSYTVIGEKLGSEAVSLADARFAELYSFAVHEANTGLDAVVFIGGQGFLFPFDQRGDPFPDVYVYMLSGPHNNKFFCRACAQNVAPGGSDTNVIGADPPLQNDFFVHRGNVVYRIGGWYYDPDNLDAPLQNNTDAYAFVVDLSQLQASTADLGTYHKLSMSYVDDPPELFWNQKYRSDVQKFSWGWVDDDGAAGFTATLAGVCSSYDVNGECTSTFPVVRATFDCPVGTVSSSETAPCVLCGFGYFNREEALIDADLMCDPCEPGRYSDVGNADECFECPIATFSDEYGAPNCSFCPPGKGSGTGAAECTDCKKGEFSEGGDKGGCRKCRVGYSNNAPGSAECKICHQDSYQDKEGQSKCIRCSDTSFSEYSGATNSSGCQCPTGFFFSDDGTKCLECPRGGVCDRSKPIVASAGYFRSADDDTVFYECSPKEACPGNNKCAKGYTGNMCGHCDDDYYWDQTKCTKCNDHVALVVMYLVYAGLIISAAFVRSDDILRRVRGAPAKSVSDTPQGTPLDTEVQGRLAMLHWSAFSGSLLTLVGHMQVIGMFSGMKLEWTKTLADLFRVFSFFNYDLSLLASECSSSPLSLVGQYRVYMILPALFTIGLAIGAVVVFLFRQAPAGVQAPEPRRRTLQDCVNRGINGLIGLLAVAHMPITYAALAVTACRDEDDGRAFLSADPGIECGSARQKKLADEAGVAIIVYVVGIPLAFAAILAFVRNRLESATVQARVGWLYQRYQREYYWWELVVMLRRFLLAVLIRTLAHEQLLQVVVLFTLMVGFAALQEYVRPHLYRGVSRLEEMFMLTEAVLIIAGVLTYSDSVTDSDRDGAEALAIILVVFSFLFVVFTLWRAMKAVRNVHDDESAELQELVNHVFLPELHLQIAEWVADANRTEKKQLKIALHALLETPPDSSSKIDDGGGKAAAAEAVEDGEGPSELQETANRD